MENLNNSNLFKKQNNNESISHYSCSGCSRCAYSKPSSKETACITPGLV